MRKYNLKSLIILMLVSFVTIQSCKKDDKTFKSTDYLTFENQEEFNNELNKVLSYTTAELKGYEANKGYKSFGRICDEIYENTNFENFSSFEELEAYVHSNNDYLQIIKEDGELYVETKIYNNAFRYFMNENKIFGIGENVYKAIEGYIISTDVKNIEKVKNINEKNYNQYIKDERFIFSPVIRKNISENYDKDAQCNCGKSKTVRRDNGKNRTKLDLDLSLSLHFDAFIGSYTNIYGKALVRPYKRTFGVWYWCKRTISCNFKTAVGIYQPEDEGWIRVNDSFSKTKYASKIERVFVNRTYGGHFYDSYAHLDGYDVWGDTPSTPPAEAKCNAYIF